MNRKPDTIYDIARELGLSASTVSRALSSHPNVRKQTREKVLNAAQQRDFRPNSLARDLRASGRALVVVTPQIAHPYYMEMYQGAYEEASALGYTIMLRQLGLGTGQNLVDELAARRPQGLLFIGGVTEAENETLGSELAQLMRYMPIVAISPTVVNLSCIYLRNDLERGVRQAVEHLKRLGHERIAFIGGASSSHPSGARERGFMLGLGGDDQPFERHQAGFTPEAGELAVQNLLEGRQQAEWPTALMATNDLVALGAMRQLSKMGLSVPRDMAVVGCDNLFFSPYTNPPLTTIDLQPLDHGRSAVRVLLNPSLTSSAPFTQLRPASLVIRESCGAQLGHLHCN